MAVKAEDRRVQRTRQLLVDALVDLILEKGYETVTVQEIIDRANVGRSTFYAHFIDKQQLLMSAFEQLRELLAQQQDAAQTATETESPRLLRFSQVLFEHAQGHYRIYKATLGKQSGAIVRAQMQGVLFDLVREEFEPLASRHSPSPVSLDVMVHYTVSAFMGLLTWWLDQKMPCSAAEMDRFFRRLALPGITVTLDTPTAEG